MKVIWETTAKVGRRQVVAYIRKWFGVKRVKQFQQEVDDTVQLLRKSPNIGQIDPLFANRAETYRSVIINGLNKMVYRIDVDVIHIVGFWDTRQEPEAQSEQTK
jgi:plasmid stabilization system protein ParE